MKKILLTLAVMLCITTIAQSQQPSYYGWRGNNVKIADAYIESLYVSLGLEINNVNADSIVTEFVKIRGNKANTDSLLNILNSLGNLVFSADSLGNIWAAGYVTADSVRVASVVATGYLITNGTLIARTDVQFNSLVDSTDVKDASMSGADLVSPLRYTGNVGITGTLGVGRGVLTNAKTVLSIYPTAAQGDTLFSICNSAGTPVAYIDSTGYIRTFANILASSTIQSSAGLLGPYFRSTGDGTVGSAAMSWFSDINLGIYRIGPDRLGITAKGAQVADFDSNGVDVTGGITSTGTATFQAFNTPVQQILADSTLTAARSGYTYIARPLAAKATATLPSNPPIGTNFPFFVADADSLLIAAAGSDSLIDGTGAAYKTTSSVAGWCKVVYGLANKWFLLQYNGTWVSY